MSNALTIRCRDPGEFIASVVEHHRGLPLPRNEDEKTYLVFVGYGDEDDILGHIPVPGDDFPEVQRRRDGLDEAGEYEDGEGFGEGQNYSYIDGENETPSPVTRGIRRLPQRIRSKRHEAEDSNDVMDDREERYHEHNQEGEGSNEGQYEELAEQSSPTLRMQQPIGGKGISGAFRPITDTAIEYYAVGYDGNGDGVEEFVGQLPQLHQNRPGAEGNSGEMDFGDEENHAGGNVESKKFSASQGPTRRFSQLHALQGEGSGVILGIPAGDNIEEKHEWVIADSQQDSDEIIEEEEQENTENDLVDGEGFSMANDKPLNPEPVLQIRDSGSPILKLQNGISPMSSPLSSPPPGSEEEGIFGESIVKVKQELNNNISGGGEEGYSKGGDGPDQDTHKERELSVELHSTGEPEDRHAVNNVHPHTPPHRQSVLEIRESGSPISPRPNEISPLTTPSYPPPPFDADEERSIASKYPAEVDEDGTPLYPIPTLENLAATEHVVLVYVPDLEALHGFLVSVMFSPPVPSTQNPPLLAIWGLVAAHYGTEHFGAVGIGCSVACAVEAAAKSGRNLVLGEGYIEVDYGEGEGEVQSWVDIDVPVMNIESMTMEVVGVSQVLRNWCRFGEDLEESGYEEE